MNDNFKKFTFFIIFLMSLSYSQKQNTDIKLVDKNWFISFSYGPQISGIKPVDFVSSNISPHFTLCTGKWVSSEFALQIGLKGFYFYTIADSDEHYYNFIYGDLLFDINKIINKRRINNNKWTFIFHPGGGYFYNHYYDRPNICANIGFLISRVFNESYDIFMDISAIMAWDIYQGNEDALPSLSIGINYGI